MRSPRIARRAEVYVTYALAHAEGEGAISGGLTDFSPPASGHFLLDHDQRHTFHAGFNAGLPDEVTAWSLVAEMGPDMAPFETAEQAASWAARRER